jgi:hypothetical protein
LPVGGNFRAGRRKLPLLKSFWDGRPEQVAVESFDMNDEHSKIIFKLLNKPHHWDSKACKLKHCANLLFKAFLAARRLSDEEQSETEDSRIADVATFLYGLAMENILKAALLKEGIAKIRPDGTIAWSAEGASDHDLLGICRSLKFIKLNAVQKKLMERLSAFVCWAGKYPTPWEIKNAAKDFKGFLLLNQPRAGIKELPMPFDDEDKKVFDQIYKIISERI